MFELKNSIYGDSIIIQTPKHIKVTSPGEKYAIVAAAPKWELHFYNMDNKMYFDGTANQFEDAVASRSAMANALTFESMTPLWKRTGTTAWQNHPVTIWTGIPSGNRPPFHHIEFWTCDDVYMPPPVSKFLHMLNNSPVSSGLPLRSVKFITKQNKEVITEPSQLKPGQFAESDFKIPSGYKPTKRSTDIFLVRNSELQHALDDFVGKDN